MAALKRIVEQELPELGTMYQFNLGLTPDLREEFTEELRYKSDDDTLDTSSWSDDRLIDEMSDYRYHDYEEDEQNRLKLERLRGRVFVFHEGREDLNHLIQEMDRLGVYDYHSREWGLISERKKEMKLREKVKEVTNPTERKRIWKEIRELNQKANTIEEALRELIPDETQQEICQKYEGDLFLNVIAQVGNLPVFEANTYRELMVKGGHPHNALVCLHYLEQTIKELSNPKYDLIPLKKHFGTETHFVTEFVEEPLNLKVWSDERNKTYGESNQTHLPEAYHLVDDPSNTFLLDESLDTVIEKSGSLIKKSYWHDKLDGEEKGVFDFYATLIRDETKRKFDEEEEECRQYVSTCENDDSESSCKSGIFWRERLEKLAIERKETMQKLSDLSVMEDKVKDRIVSDYAVLIALRGYGALYHDLNKIRKIGFEPEKEISRSSGAARVDVRLEHIFFRGFNEEGVPQFSIIDMYHLGMSELAYKRRIFRDEPPKLGLRLGPSLGYRR